MIEENLPTALPYLPPSETPKPVVIESRMAQRPSVAPAMKRAQNRNIARTWMLLGAGLLVGAAAIVWEML